MNIILAGTGNVGINLAYALKKRGHSIIQFAGRSNNKPEIIKKFRIDYTCRLPEIKKNTDLIIIAVNDDNIPSVADQIPDFGSVTVVHTSGSVEMNVLSKFRSHGVLYPLQSFSKEKIIPFKKIPLCIEANNKNALRKIQDLSDQLSDNVHLISSDERKILHLAAVFACNFTNHMYAISEEILLKNGLPPDLLKPLINHTAARLDQMPARKAQTGPAKRNDKKIIEKHLKLLSYSPKLQKIYKTLSDNIQQDKQ